MCSSIVSSISYFDHGKLFLAVAWYPATYWRLGGQYSYNINRFQNIGKHSAIKWLMTWLSVEPNYSIWISFWFRKVCVLDFVLLPGTIRILGCGCVCVERINYFVTNHYWWPCGNLLYFLIKKLQHVTIDFAMSANLDEDTIQLDDVSILFGDE